MALKRARQARRFGAREERHMNFEKYTDRVKGFVQAQNWIQDLTPITMG